jgi:hypothetical protein
MEIGVLAAVLGRAEIFGGSRNEVSAQAPGQTKHFKIYL